MSKRKGQINVDLGYELRKEAKILAAQRDMPFAELIKEAVEHFLLCAGESFVGKSESVKRFLDVASEQAAAVDKDEVFNLINDGRKDGKVLFLIIDEWCDEQAAQAPGDTDSEAA